MATISAAFALARQHQQAGRLDMAEEICRRVVAAEPSHADALYLLGIIAYQTGQPTAAVEHIGRAIALNPLCAGYHNDLGEVYYALRKIPAAIACYQRAKELQPQLAEADNNLGNALTCQGQLEAAVACFRRAIQIKPELAEAHNNLGSVLAQQGEFDEAIACVRRALQLNPDYAEAQANLTSILNYSLDGDAREIYEEYRRWNEQYAEPLRRFQRPHPNDRSPGRRLRIGYVSPDFRQHPVGRFLLPLLESHDRQAVEVLCYASVRVPDDVTDRCRACAHVWRNALDLSDAQLAEAVRRDQIDILVDLTMHMQDHRLLVFARKPAPVQVTYLAYCGTTGLSAIDYRLTDPYLDPPDQAEPFYSEQSIRLPETYWCYRPLIETPQVQAPPASTAGHVTFGCLNNFCKVTPTTLAMWGRLLQAMPEARLLLHAHEGSHRDRVRDKLARQGVSPGRLTFVDLLPVAEYFRLYDRIDVALDTFPHGGGTTTCDALWMGVPVVSLAGQRAVGRGGLSILSNVGLPDLVARDADQYLRIALDLAGDLPRLRELRASLRDRMRNSPLMDAPRFARNVEAAYRLMWQRWCDNPSESPNPNP